MLSFTILCFINVILSNQAYLRINRFEYKYNLRSAETPDIFIGSKLKGRVKAITKYSDLLLVI